MSDAAAEALDTATLDVGLDPEEALSLRPTAAAPRDGDLLGRADSPIREALDKLFGDIAKGFEDQSRRSDDQQDYWDCYNCQPNQHRYYNGIADIYLPISHDAVEARATRNVNQLFPGSDRYVDAVATDGSMQWEMIALAEHYIRAANFKTDVAMPLARNGDIEGQYNLYVDWMEVERQLVSRETRRPRDPQSGMEMPGEEIADITEEDVVEGTPIFEVLHDADVLVLPATADSVEKALAEGGAVAIVRRWTKAKLQMMADDKMILRSAARELKDAMARMEQPSRDTESRILEHVGIKKGGKELTVWEVWTMLPLKNGRYSEGGTKRLCRVFMGPHRVMMGAKRNPYWNDRCPLLSRPVIKEAGSFKGPSLIRYIESLQYEANDAVNEGADAATLSAAPIVTRDPEKYDGPLVYNMGAVWDIPPDAVKLLTFPDLTPRAMQRTQMAQAAIFQTLSVNPSMVPHQTGKPGAKRNQAEIAMEQSVDLLTAAMATSVLDEMFTDVVGWIIDLDYQFRTDRDLMVRKFGEMGREMRMAAVAPLQNRNGFSFLWRGGEQVRQNAAMMQQGTGWLNVLRGLRQDLQQEGVTLRLAPIVEAGTRNLFGPVLGSRTIIDQRSSQTVDPEEENKMMADGFEVPVHPLDDDAAHIQAHQRALQMGDPHGTVRVHLQAQMRQQGMKQAAAQQQAMQQMMAQRMQQQGGPPGPPGGQPGPGAPPGMRPGGTPPGAVPAGPRLIKGPPGMIHPDQMPRAGAVPMPRKM